MAIPNRGVRIAAMCQFRELFDDCLSECEMQVSDDETLPEQSTRMLSILKVRGWGTDGALVVCPACLAREQVRRVLAKAGFRSLIEVP